MRFRSRWGPGLLAAATLASFGIACKGAHADAKKDGFGEMTVEDVQAAIAKGDTAIFDNNSKKRWAESHVPTAKWVDYKALKKADLPDDTGKRLVFYCANEF